MRRAGECRYAPKHKGWSNNRGRVKGAQGNLPIAIDIFNSCGADGRVRSTERQMAERPVNRRSV